MSEYAVNAIGVTVAIVSLVFEIAVFFVIDKRFGLIKTLRTLLAKECKIDLSNPFVYHNCSYDVLKPCIDSDGQVEIAEFDVDFKNYELSSDGDKFAGIAFKEFEEYNWKKFLKKDYQLVFEMELDGNDEQITYQIEVNTIDQNRKHKSKLLKSSEKKTIQKIDICSISNSVKLWKNIGELCVVFFPSQSNYKGKMIIKDMVIKKK